MIQTARLTRHQLSYQPPVPNSLFYPCCLGTRLSPTPMCKTTPQRRIYNLLPRQHYCTREIWATFLDVAWVTGLFNFNYNRNIKSYGVWLSYHSIYTSFRDTIHCPQTKSCSTHFTLIQYEMIPVV